MPFTKDELKIFGINFAVAGVTSIFAKTITAPFDRVKLILQNQKSVLQILTGERRAYNGVMDCLVRLPQEQGYLSFWRGNGVNLIRYFPTQALNFSFYDYFKHRFYRLLGTDKPGKVTFIKFMSGGLAGACATSICYPLEFCQTRVTVDIGSDAPTRKTASPMVKREFGGLTDCIRKVRIKDGPQGLYRGFTIAIIGVTFYRSMYFGFFDIMKKIWAREHIHTHHDAPKPPFFIGLLFAQVATCISGTISYPLDTVGRRLMMEAGRPAKLQLFNNTWGAFKTIYTIEGGLRPFYRMNDEAKIFIFNIVIVSIASSIAKTLTAPIDRVKLILQNQDSALQVLRGERTRYSGIIDCLRRVPQEQGFISLWRGNGTNILRYFPTQALNFAFNDFYKKLFHNAIGDDTHFRSVMLKFLSGGLAGACSITIMYPLEFCQTRIAVDIGDNSRRFNTRVKREFTGLGDCIRKVNRVAGVGGLYGGYAFGVVGISCYRALYFGLFDSVKHLWAQKKATDHYDAPKPPMLVGLLLAQAVTCLSGICTYPMDTVARRLMLDSGRPRELRLFRSTWSAVWVMYKNEGIYTFYKGALTNCLRGMSGALVLVFYDEVLHYTQWKKWVSPCDNC